MSNSGATRWTTSLVYSWASWAPNFGDLVRSLLTKSVELEPELVDFGPKSAQIDRVGGDLDRTRPDFGPPKEAPATASLDSAWRDEARFAILLLGLLDPDMS